MKTINFLNILQNIKTKFFRHSFIQLTQNCSTFVPILNKAFLPITNPRKLIFIQHFSNSTILNQFFSDHYNSPNKFSSNHIITHNKVASNIFMSQHFKLHIKHESHRTVSKEVKLCILTK